MPKGAAGRVQGRAFEVPETHYSLGPGEQRAHNTRGKPTQVHSSACPLGSDSPRAKQFFP